MVDKNDTLFKEVDEELRREQMAKLWEQYGIYVIAAASLIVALVGGFKFWEARQASLAEEAGARYENAIALAESGKADESSKALTSLAEDGPAGYRTLSELTIAGSHLKAGRPQDALAVFEKLAKDSSVDPLLSSFASLQAAALRLGEADFTEMQNRLNPLIGEGSAWRFNARELLGLAALRAGNLDEARTTLAPLLADKAVPATTVERVERVMAMLAAKELSSAASSAAPAVGTGDAAETPAAAPGGTAETPQTAPK